MPVQALVRVWMRAKKADLWWSCEVVGIDGDGDGDEEGSLRKGGYMRERVKVW